MCKVVFGNKVMEWERLRNVNRNEEENRTQARIATMTGIRFLSGENFDYKKKKM